MRTRTNGGVIAGLPTSAPDDRHTSLRSAATVCLRLRHAVPTVGIDFLMGIAVFAVIRIPMVEFGNKFNRIVTRQVPTSLLDSGAYSSAMLVVHAASFVLIGWVIGGLRPGRRARALAGAITYSCFLPWWYSTTAEIPPSQSVAHFVSELINVTIVIGGIVVGYRLWSNPRGNSAPGAKSN
jgi:hypothetical protein